MPMYEYACDKCELVHEELRSVNSMNDPFSCSECGEDCRKIISRPAGFRFGGADGKAHDMTLAKKRKDAYWKSDQGKDELGAQKLKLVKKYGTI
jgi:putative FmdB family regulatory protein